MSDAGSIPAAAGPYYESIFQRCWRKLSFGQFIKRIFSTNRLALLDIPNENILLIYS